MAGVIEYSPLLKAPFVACLWIVDTCNLRCKYCYAMPFSGSMMNTQRMLSLIDELIELEVFDITLAGGEPFMHPDVLVAIDRLVRSGKNLGVLSNGSLLDSATTDKLVTILEGRNNFLLQITIDGVQPELHNRTRGQGELVLKNLEYICKTTDIQLQLATVLNSNNIDCAHKIIETYYPRIKRFHFLNLQRTSRSLQFDELFVPEERIRGFWDNLSLYMGNMPNDILVTSLNVMRDLYTMHDIPNHRLHNSTLRCSSCTAGVTHVEINATFDVLGCDIAKDYTRMGNVSASSFNDVWRSRQAEHIRNYPFPACYLIKSPDGSCLADNLPQPVASYLNLCPHHL
jgi:MoaA/NifB/PqqE/SkfB family radical SAM enzyme